MVSVPDVGKLGADEARSLTDAVKQDAAELWTKLLRLYEGGAHVALGYSSWATYCAAEFEMTDASAYRLLGAARVVAQLPMGSSPPKNERQARELAPLRDQPEEMAAALEEAAAGGEPTTASVRAAVRRRLGLDFSDEASGAPPVTLPAHWTPGLVEAVTRVRVALVSCDPGALKALDAAISKEPEPATAEAPSERRRFGQKAPAARGARGCTFDTPRGVKCKLCGRVH